MSIGGGTITDLRFADDIDALAEEEEELETLVESLDKTCTRYKMEIRTVKTKLMTYRANGIQNEINVQSTLKQLFQMMAQTWRLSKGQHKPLQL